MPILLILFIVLFIGIVLHKRRKPCKWERTGGHGELKEFTCKYCNVTAFSTQYDGPPDCKRNIKDASL
ncbi:hypothetical protein BFP70_17595 [Thioclava sp. SK-1]|nr:hypothetical protein BFP70_17595 [Thioclava sp. SK-1]